MDRRLRTNKKWFIYTGIAWTVLFAFMSFYWAAGGMIGVKSLGGEIYQKALDRDQDFIPIVWGTGIIKLGGVVLLVLLLGKNLPQRIEKWLRLISIATGIFFALYGLMNFITISLAAVNILDFELDAYATKWRLMFWEPFWVLGGILYILSGKKSKVKN